MGIRVDRYWVVYDSMSMKAIDPEYLFIAEDKIKEYVKENPMPEDPEYSSEDLIGDITESSGFYTLPDNVKVETRNYVANLLNDLI